MYEQIECGPRPANDADVRQVAWKALCSGSYGYTYGGAAIWLFKWSKEDTRGEKYNPGTWWREGMDLPGSGQMRHLRDFFSSLEWWKLEPRFADKQWSSLADTERTVVASDSNRCYVVYTYGPKMELGTLRGLAIDADHAAWWFDPRTGRRYLISPSFRVADRSWTMPAKPTAADWVLLVKQGAVEAPRMDGK